MTEEYNYCSKQYDISAKIRKRSQIEVLFKNKPSYSLVDDTGLVYPTSKKGIKKNEKERPYKNI